MVTRAYLALMMAAALLLLSAGVAAAENSDTPRSIWGADNPGQGAAHAVKPLEGAEHNRAGYNHPDGGGASLSG